MSSWVCLSKEQNKDGGDMSHHLITYLRSYDREAAMRMQHQEETTGVRADPVRRDMQLQHLYNVT